MLKLSSASSSVAFLFLLLVVARTTTTTTAMTDSATGIAFAPKKNGLEIFGVGARKKGPIKVYSVAMYCTSALRDKLAAFGKADPKAAACLQEGAHEEGSSFLLEMSFKVGAEKMASAIAESVAPRHRGDPDEVETLKSLIFNGVAEKGATKGTRFQFDCSAGGIDVAVDGKAQGSVPSSGLARAFCDVYLDDKCVSPALKSSILEHCCAP